jgi:hypothetical protein
MKEEQNIDKIFREKLEGFTEEPPAFIWPGIMDQMKAARLKKRRVWYSWSAVAALLLLAFIAGWYLNENSTPPVIVQTEPVRQEEVPVREENEPVAQSPSGEETGEETQESVGIENLYANSETGKKEAIPATKRRQSVRQEETVTYTRADLAFFRKLEPAEAVVLFSEEIAHDEPATRADVAFVLTTMDQEIIAGNIRSDIKAPVPEDKWKLGMNISPGYSSYSARHSSAYASNMTYEATDGNSNMSGGISIRYKTAKRWNVESGIYYAQNGQKTGSSPQLFAGRSEATYDAAPVEKLYFNTAVAMSNNKIAMNSTAGVISIENMPKGAEIAANLESAAGFQNAFISQGEFSQVFDFVEVPLYIRYLLFGSKMNVEIIGGINAGIVVGNNAYLDNQYGLQHIGETSDISTLNLSGTMGVGLTYNLGRRISFALEPRMNYYLNSISRNDDVDFRPYRVGFYTGVYYAF